MELAALVRSLGYLEYADCPLSSSSSNSNNVAETPPATTATAIVAENLSLRRSFNEKMLTCVMTSHTEMSFFDIECMLDGILRFKVSVCCCVHCSCCSVNIIVTMFVFMYVCMYVCICVCMYMCTLYLTLQWAACKILSSDRFHFTASFSSSFVDYCFYITTLLLFICYYR